MSNKLSLDDNINLDGHFWFEYKRLESGSFLINLYDKDQGLYASVTSENLNDAWRHIFHYADPLINANLFPDHYDWQFKHEIKWQN